MTAAKIRRRFIWQNFGDFYMEFLVFTQIHTEGCGEYVGAL